MSQTITEVYIDKDFKIKINVFNIVMETKWQVILVEAIHPNQGWMPWFSLVETCDSMTFQTHSAATQKHIRQVLNGITTNTGLDSWLHAKIAFLKNGTLDGLYKLTDPFDNILFQGTMESCTDWAIQNDHHIQRN